MAAVSNLQAENTMLRDALESAEAKVEDLDEKLAETEIRLDTVVARIGPEWERQ